MQTKESMSVQCWHNAAVCMELHNRHLWPCKLKIDTTVNPALGNIHTNFVIFFSIAETNRLTQKTVNGTNYLSSLQVLLLLLIDTFHLLYTVYSQTETDCASSTNTTDNT